MPLGEAEEFGRFSLEVELDEDGRFVAHHPGVVAGSRTMTCLSVMNVGISDSQRVADVGRAGYTVLTRVLT